MQVANPTNLPEATVTEIEREIGGFRSLLEALSHVTSGEHKAVPKVVVQDEYTHDIVVPWRDGLVLVYDAT